MPYKYMHSVLTFFGKNILNNEIDGDDVIMVMLPTRSLESAVSVSV